MTSIRSAALLFTAHLLSFTMLASSCSTDSAWHSAAERSRVDEQQINEALNAGDSTRAAKLRQDIADQCHKVAGLKPDHSPDEAAMRRACNAVRAPLPQ